MSLLNSLCTSLSFRRGGRAVVVHPAGGSTDAGTMKDVSAPPHPCFRDKHEEVKG